MQGSSDGVSEKLNMINLVVGKIVWTITVIININPSYISKIKFLKIFVEFIRLKLLVTLFDVNFCFKGRRHNTVNQNDDYIILFDLHLQFTVPDLFFYSLSRRPSFLEFSYYGIKVVLWYYLLLNNIRVYYYYCVIRESVDY